jgi:hypothetical protein
VRRQGADAVALCRGAPHHSTLCGFSLQSVGRSTVSSLVAQRTQRRSSGGPGQCRTSAGPVPSVTAACSNASGSDRITQHCGRSAGDSIADSKSIDSCEPSTLTQCTVYTTVRLAAGQGRACICGARARGRALRRVAAVQQSHSDPTPLPLPLRCALLGLFRSALPAAKIAAPAEYRRPSCYIIRERPAECASAPQR